MPFGLMAYNAGWKPRTRPFSPPMLRKSHPRSAYALGWKDLDKKTRGNCRMGKGLTVGYPPIAGGEWEAGSCEG